MMAKELLEKPTDVSPTVAKELDKVEEQLKAREDNYKGLTLDNMNTAPISEVEYKMSQADVGNSTDVYLKPVKSIGPGVNAKTGARETFNEKFRKAYEFQKEYVQFTAYNNMIIGEDIEMWTKPFPGVNCDMWRIPCNKPIWAPRYVAEQLTRCRHHTLTMQKETITGADGMGQYTGQIVAKSTVQRLDAQPVQSKKSIFMGANSL
jgi:hypothetical protein